MKLMETKPTIYTQEYVLAEVTLLLNNLLLDKEIVFKGELIDPRPYSYKRYHEWKNDFKDDSEIMATMDKIEGMLLTRAVVGGLKNKLSPVMTKFHLINNFDWRDKSEQELTGADKTPLIPQVNILGYKDFNPQNNASGSKDMVEGFQRSTLDERDSS